MVKSDGHSWGTKCSFGFGRSENSSMWRILTMLISQEHLAEAFIVRIWCRDLVQDCMVLLPALLVLLLLSYGEATTAFKCHGGRGSGASSPLHGALPSMATPPDGQSSVSQKSRWCAPLCESARPYLLVASSITKVLCKIQWIYNKSKECGKI